MNYENLKGTDLLAYYINFVDGLIAPPPAVLPPALFYQWRLTHCLYGFLCELLELNETGANMEEELGDIFFYLFGALKNLNIENHVILSEINLNLTEEQHDSGGAMNRSTVEYIEIVANYGKKLVFYLNPEAFPTLFTSLTTLISRLLYETQERTNGRARWEDVIRGNIKKLMHRYPDGFNLTASILRKDKEHEENHA